MQAAATAGGIVQALPLLGGGPFHSQCPEAWFLRTPGWKIVAPATPEDAKGLMIAASRDGNPVIFLECKGLYSFFRTDLREEVPLGTGFEVPLGSAAVRREGRDITCATYGAMTWTALEAAQRLEKEKISLEVLDLRSLVPLDEESLLRSVAKTHRLMVLHEDSKRGGPGAEIAALVAEKALYDLEAPIARVAAPDQPVPYSPPMEWGHLPKAGDVVQAARELIKKAAKASMASEATQTETNRYPLKKAFLNDLFCQITTFGLPLLWAVFLWDPIKILLGMKKVAPVDRKQMWAWVPYVALVSVVLPLFGLWRARYLQAKLSGAKEVIARVTSVGSLNMKGWRTVNFDYDFDGKSFKGTASLPSLLAEKLGPGSDLPILVPPKSPSKSFLKSTYA